jgi:hypothetical protein
MSTPAAWRCVLAALDDVRDDRACKDAAKECEREPPERAMGGVAGGGSSTSFDTDKRTHPLPSCRRWVGNHQQETTRNATRSSTHSPRRWRALVTRAQRRSLKGCPRALAAMAASERNGP